jgi:hypothetical protein
MLACERIQPQSLRVKNSSGPSSPILPPKEYPIQHWRDDYAWFCSETRQRGPASMGMDEFRSHFRSTRPNPIIAEYCLQRFVAAMQYLEANIQALDFGKFAVVGNDRFMVHKSVIITLYRFYAARPDNHIDDVVPIESFIKELEKSSESIG